MIVVIQCAASKVSDAGHLRALDGTPILFVADPPKAPYSEKFRYAKPDGASDTGRTWREVLLEYNRAPNGNPLGLCQAYALYDNAVYGRLVAYLGANKVYILSAGWGLIGAPFLTPNYDITFSQSADAYKRRRKGERHEDLCMLADADDSVVFLGGKDYVPLFCALTSGRGGQRIVLYNSDFPPNAPGCVLQRFVTTTRTNWHYECANALISGKINIHG